MSRLSIPSITLAITLAGLSALPSAPAPKAGEKSADWIQFRGANRDNISPDKNLLKEWPKDGPELLWKSEGVGVGYSSVSVVGDKVFTMGDKDKMSHVFAVDRVTGKQLWATKVGKAGGVYSGTRCTPTVDGKLLYAIGQFGDLVCLDVEKGEEKWRKDFVKDYGGRIGRWNFAESPLVDGDRLVFTPGGLKATMVALDKLTGEEVWRSPIGDIAGYSSIVISNAAGVKQYVQLTAAGTIGVAAKDGKFLWRYKELAGTIANVPTPIVLGDQIFTAAGYNKGGALLTLSSGGETGVTMKQKYYKPELKNKHGGVLAVGDYVYGDTDEGGNPYCAKWKTGEVVWTRKIQGKGRKQEGQGSGSCAITYADGHLYCRYRNGHVALVPVPGTKYTESGSLKIKNYTQDSWPHPVVIGGKLYLREQNILWCYDIQAK